MNTQPASITQINAKEHQVNPAMRDKIASMVKERGITNGKLSLNIARQLYPKARTGDQMEVAGARFVVGK